MVKPSLPHHGPSIVGTTVPIVPPSQSMVLLTSAGRFANFSHNDLTFKKLIAASSRAMGAIRMSTAAAMVPVSLAMTLFGRLMPLPKSDFTGVAIPDV